MQEDAGVGAGDLAQGGAGLVGFALVFAGHGQHVDHVGVLAARLDGAIQKLGGGLEARGIFLFDRDRVNHFDTRHGSSAQLSNRLIWNVAIGTVSVSHPSQKGVGEHRGP